VLFTVFERQDYAMHLRTLPRVIIDAVAYTDYTAIYFAEKYPAAKIIAIEPVLSNFELLQRNTANYPQIFPINKALWYKNTRIQIHDQSTGHWGYAVTENTVQTSIILGEIDTITVDDIMREFQINRIDLLKVDIEGAEKEIFEHCHQWIANIEVIAIELHARIKEKCSQAFYGATQEFEFERKNDMTVFKSRVGMV
jgi:FkbM family methyltransferase